MGYAPEAPQGASGGAEPPGWSIFFSIYGMCASDISLMGPGPGPYAGGVGAQPPTGVAPLRLSTGSVFYTLSLPLGLPTSDQSLKKSIKNTTKSTISEKMQAAEEAKKTPEKKKK